MSVPAPARQEAQREGRPGGLDAGSGVVPGRPVTVRVPATSANLGPGFDSLGLALDLHDLITAEAGPGGLEIDVEGEGAADVPRGEEHLVVRAVRAGLAHAGAGVPGLRLHCVNAIPHGRGLGSSASAVVAGLLVARGLLADPSPLDDATVLRLATRFEGHPDNAAAALYGGFTVSWTGTGPVAPPHEPPPVQAVRDTALPPAHAVRVEVDARVRVVACVPGDELATSLARAMLPAEVPHGDAAFNASRSALLVEALIRRPELLLAATEDRLHQRQRAAAMPATAALVARLRGAGLAAVVSGAGPSVLVLGAGEAPAEAVARAAGGDAAGWRILNVAIATNGARVITERPR